MILEIIAIETVYSVVNDIYSSKVLVYILTFLQRNSQT